MANIQLKIRTLADNDTEINSIKNTGNNVTNGSVKLANSEGFFATIPTADFAGQELLTFAGGALQFTSNGILANGSGNVGKLVDESDGKEFIWGVVPESKEYFVEVQLGISDLDLTAITLYGDSVAQQYPTEVIVNGETYQNDDVVLTIPVNTNSTQINVKMTKWKRANYNACLTKIAIFAGEIQLENRDIKSLESLSQSTGQPESIFYGCVPSSGSASINDRKGEFYDYIKKGIISNSNSVIDLFVNGKKVQTHIATDSDYDLGGRVFSLDLENKLSAYDNIMYEGYPYTGNPQSLYVIFKGFAEKVGFTSEQIEKMLSTEIEYTGDENNYVNTVAEYFKAIIIPYPYIERGTIRETLDKFCTLAQLNLLEDDNGDLIFVQARPIRTGRERVLVIPAKNQMSSIDRNIIVKNGVNEANVVVSKAQDVVDINTLLYTEKPTNPSLVSQSNVDKFVYEEYTTHVGWAIYVLQTNIGYYQGSVVIPKKRNLNLDNIENLYTGVNSNGEPYIKHQLKCVRKTGKASVPISCTYSSYEGAYIPNKPSYSSITYTEETSDNVTVSFGSNPLDTKFSMYNMNTGALALECSLSNVATLDNLATLKYTLNENGDYVISYSVFARKKTVHLYGDYSGTETKTLAGEYSKGDLYGVAGNWAGFEEYVPQQLEISFYGDKRVISFEQENTLDSEQGNGSFVSITGNELLQDDALVRYGFQLENLSDRISNNIVTDYKNGVSTCRVTVICGDYKDEAGVVRKNWAKGEILQVGDIVRLDKDNDGTPAMTYNDGSTMLWKITGRNLRHEGVSLLDLELQEIF